MTYIVSGGALNPTHYPKFLLRHYWWGRSAYFARAGLKSQSAPVRKHYERIIQNG